MNLLVCVEVITEGFDVPMIDSILMLRPTQSLSLYLQMIGRSMRAAPGKRHALILDAVGNWSQHGLPEEDRTEMWQLEARGEDGEGGLPPIRICPRCNSLNHASVRICKACGCSLGRECPRCGTFVFENDPFIETDTGETMCLSCDDERQNNIFEAGVGTVVSGRPYYLSWLNEYGVETDARVSGGPTALVTSRKGYRWFTKLIRLVGKNGRSYIYQTDGKRKFTQRVKEDGVNGSPKITDGQEH